MKVIFHQASIEWIILLTPLRQLSDGPSGARGEIFGESVPAAFFPSGVSLGATWDVDLMYEIGEALAEEV